MSVMGFYITRRLAKGWRLKLILIQLNCFGTGHGRTVIPQY